MSRQLSICIVGDLMLDVVTRLPDLSFTRVNDAKSFTRPQKIDIYAGGTGTHLARSAALQGFSSVSLIGKIGVHPQHGQPDASAQFIIHELQQYDVKMIFAHDAHMNTGTTMITYLAGNERLLIYHRGANSSFSTRDITPELRDSVTRADILFVSGYTLLVPEQAMAVVDLMQEAQRHNRLVVLDVVPHKLYETIDSQTFQSYTRFVDVIISEVESIKQLFPPIQTFDGYEQLAAIASYLTRDYRAVILNATNEYQYIYDRQGFIEKTATGYVDDGFAQGLSYLERVSLTLLRKHYQRFSNPSLIKDVFE